MNYYIHGDAARAEEIKAEFEKLGYKTIEYCFNAEMTLYFTFGGAIKTAAYEPYKSIIKTHPDYKELELPVEPKFKVGDWAIDKYVTDCVFQITKILDNSYEITEKDGHVTSCLQCDIDDNSRLWTIQDAKDGDVLSYQGEVFITRIARGLSANVAIDYDCCYDGNSFILDSFYSLTMDELKEVYPATKQQRDLLFAKMKEAGYQWDVDKKELCKIQPHYDISNFYPGMPVLVRANNDCRWDYSVFSRITGNGYWRFAVCNGVNFTQCIPFEGNEHLLGTTDMCDEQYINW